MKGNFFAYQPSPTTPSKASESRVESPINLGGCKPAEPVESRKRPRQESLLRMASEEDQKLVQRILAVLRSHNGHFRRLSWTNERSREDPKHRMSKEETICTPKRKRARRVTFDEKNEVRYVDHELTDYGLPMMTAIPGTGNGTNNPQSEWHKRPHTGWYNKYVGADDRPKWWYYDCEFEEKRHDQGGLSSSTSSNSILEMEYHEEGKASFLEGYSGSTFRSGREDSFSSSENEEGNELFQLDQLTVDAIEKAEKYRYGDSIMQRSPKRGRKS